MAKKRPLEEFEGVSEIQICKSAKVQGVVTSLSPLKSNKTGTTKYFEGEISDGKSCRRLVGFDAKLHSKLQEYHEKNEALALGNCEIKQSRYGSELEVVVRSNSDVYQSPTKFDVASSSVSRHLGSDVTLVELTQLANFQKITVRIKVMAVKESETVKNGFVKQDCIVADASASCKLVLWGDSLEEDISYKLSGLIMRTYNGKKYLSIPKDSSFDFEVIGDIGVTVEKEVEEEGKMKGAIVIGVKYFDAYNACYSCKGKVVVSGSVGECGRCGMMQRVEKCKMAVTVKMDIEADGCVKCVSAFSPIVEEICEGDVSKAALLSCQAFDVVFNENNVVISVSR